MENWKNKVAIVTGASAGIGAEIAKRLVKEGMIVVGLARRSHLIDELSSELSDEPGKLYSYKADISKEEEIKEAFQWTVNNVGPIHLLINNAGVVLDTGLIDGDVEKWKETLNTNILGNTICTKEAIKIMRDNNINGNIIFISDTGAHYVYYRPDFNVYGASKYAITNLLEFWRRELIEYGSKIKVSSISPGTVRTGIMESFSPEGTEFMRTTLSLLPSDLADAVIYTITRPLNTQVYDIKIIPTGDKEM